MNNPGDIAARLAALGSRLGFAATEMASAAPDSPSAALPTGEGAEVAGGSSEAPGEPSEADGVVVLAPRHDPAHDGRHVRPAWYPSPEQQRRLASAVLHGPQRKLCGAWARGAGRPCIAPVVPGRPRCKHHGGLSSGPKTRAGREQARRNGSRTLREAHQARAILNRLVREGRRDVLHLLGVIWPPRDADTEESA